MPLLGIINFWPLKKWGCLKGNFPSEAEKMQFLNSICKIWCISFTNILLKIHYSFPMKYWLLSCLFLPPFHFSFMILAIIMSIPLTFPVLMLLPNYYKPFFSNWREDRSVWGESAPPPEADRNKTIFKLNLHGYTSLFQHVVSSTSF